MIAFGILVKALIAEKSPISGCEGALDGLPIRIREQSANEIVIPVTNFNRKDAFAVCVQAVCDSNYRLIFASPLCPGYTHDSVAFLFNVFVKTTRSGAFESILDCS
jgi:hypothetical protein